MAAPTKATFGLLGRTLGHSWSPKIHAGLGSSPYELIELEPDEVVPFIREGSWRGLNVTIPYKRVAAEAADLRSPRVEALGVANTLVHDEQGRVFAENTDVLGFGYLLDRFFLECHGQKACELLAGRKALVLGTGGAAQAVHASLAERGAQTVLISRTGDETYATLVERHADAILVVNTTPVGMDPHGPASPLEPGTLARLPQLKGVVDVVYNPERTGIVMEAERLGIPAASGLEMLVAQAYYASALFQHKTLDEGLVEKIIGQLRRETRNVALIGMPGAGKTTTGRSLARLTGRPFIDLDDAFTLRFGMSAATCIRELGEPEFRARETEVLASYGASSGIIIACGGGVVTQPRNYELLHQNATIVFLDRSIEELSSEDRPLSQAKGVRKLAEERMGLYRQWADLAICCTGSAAGDARGIKATLGL